MMTLETSPLYLAQLADQPVPILRGLPQLVWFCAAGISLGTCFLPSMVLAFLLGWWTMPLWLIAGLVLGTHLITRYLSQRQANGPEGLATWIIAAHFQTWLKLSEVSKVELMIEPDPIWDILLSNT